MTTTNMSLNEPSVGTTAGPTWATEVNANFTTIDQHDHTSGKGVQLTPSALNINSDLEFNGNAAIELKRLTFDSSATGSGTNYSVYQSGGNLYWYNGSGIAVQITNGSNVKTTGGSIDGMSGTDAAVDYGSGIYKFEFDSTKTPFAGAKMSHADINLYKYDGSSGSNAYVILKYTGSSAGSNNLTFPDETGTLLSTATSFGGAINIDATGGSGSITLDAATSVSIEADTTITLDAETDINLDSNSGVLTFKDNGTAIGKISNSSSDLVIENEVDAKDIIFKQYDGNEVVRMADDRRLYFYDKGGEYIVGDGTDLTVASGGAINLTATTDVVVPANVGVTFGTGEKIEGDNTDLTLTSGADINLTATADVNLPNDVGLVFGDDGEKIEGNGTKLDIAASELDFSIESGGDINIGANIGLTFGNDGEKIEGDGTDLTIASSGEINVNSGTLDLSAQTVDVTLNAAVDALNFDSNTLSIDASNNRIGIGTAAPDNLLDVRGGNVSATTNNAMAIVQSTDSFAIDKGGSIGFAGKYNTSGSIAAWGQIGGRKETTGDGNYASYMQFSTRANGASLTEKMRITSAGRVGIGTSVPYGALNVSDSGGFTTLVITDPTENASGEHWYFRNTGGNFYIGQSTDSGGAWDAITARVAILDGGNVGLGIDAPVAHLDIDVTDSASFANRVTNISGASVGIKTDFTNSRYTNIYGVYSAANNATKTKAAHWMTTDTTNGTTLSWGTTNNFANGVTRTDLSINYSGAVSVAGSFSKGSGSFKIDHPLESKSETHHLVHSFIEGPQADLIYRGKVALVRGKATVNIDTEAGLTEGTFVLLNTNTQCFTSNESGFVEVKGSVSGNILTITAQENTSTDTISWLVIGERHDPHMIETLWTDENGKVIVEPTKEPKNE